MSLPKIDEVLHPGPVSKTRRAHHKSRNGCFNCRKRRVKCDEQHPICRSCRRRGAQCEWPEVPPTQFQSFGIFVTRQVEQRRPALPPPRHDCSHYAQLKARASPDSASDPPPAVVSLACGAYPSTSGTTFELSDLALLHHWTVSTSVQTGVPKDHVEFFQRIIPEVGFTHPFVSHAMLSVAALHLAHLSKVGREQHIIRAVQHHSESLKGFRGAVSNISEGNSEALFVWSTLNSLYVLSLATQSPRQAPDRRDRILGAEWVPMLQGVTAILHPILGHLQHGRFKDLLTLRGWRDLDPDKPFDACLDTPLSRIRESWKDSNHASTYESAFSVLRKCLLFVSQFDDTREDSRSEWGYNRALSGSLLFIHASPREYFTLLRERQPPALILFAYFGMLLHGQRDCWVIDSLGQEVMEVVGELLGSCWRSWIPTVGDIRKTHVQASCDSRPMKLDVEGGLR